MKTMPCGYVRTGKLKEHLAHYRTCSHPACKARVSRFAGMVSEMKTDRAALAKLKGEAK